MLRIMRLVQKDIDTYVVVDSKLGMEWMDALELIQKLASTSATARTAVVYYEDIGGKQKEYFQALWNDDNSKSLQVAFDELFRKYEGDIDY